MPLVRLEVRNEYGLGNPELYRGAAWREDPRAVLDGVAVSGLVGILRQLGDLAGFASEIFHDLHEQVVATSARGHRMMARVQRIEAALPQIENAVETQKSHIHFAYLPGSDWHANIPIEHDHLIGSELPRFIMDSYEECHDPPRLFLLDKFGSAGAGACLKRYSDPTYFKRVSASSQMMKVEKYNKEKKPHKSKRKGQWMLNREVQHPSSLSCHNSSIQITSPATDDRSIAAETMSTSDMRLKSDLGSRSASFDSRTRFSCEEPVVNTNSSAEHGESMFSEPSVSKLEIDCSNGCDSLTAAEHNIGADDDSLHGSLQEQNGPRSPSVTWDEKTEILKTNSFDFCGEDIIESVQNSESSAIISDHLKVDSVSIKSEQSDKEHLSFYVRSMPHQENISPDAGDVMASFSGANHSDEVTNQTDKCVDKEDISFYATSAPHQEDISSDTRSLPVSYSGAYNFDEVTSETDNYVDALNTLESETDTDSEFQTIREVKPSSIYSNQTENRVGNMQEMSLPKSDFLVDGISNVSQDFLNKKMSPEIDSISSEGVSYPQSLPVIGLDPDKSISLENDLCESTCPVPQTSGKNEISNEQSSRCSISDVQTQSSGSNITKLQTALEDEKVLDVYNTPETCANSDEPPIKIWTNGGLLGLEPSKPPDFIKPAILSQMSALSTSKGGCSYSAPDSQVDGYSTRHEAFIQSDESILKNTSSNMERNGLLKSTETITLCTSQVVGKKEHEVQPVYPSDHSPLCSDHGNEFQNLCSTTIRQKGHNLEDNKVATPIRQKGHNLKDNIVSTRGNESPVTSVGVSSTEDTCISSSLPSLARKFLASNLQKKVLLNHADIQSSSTMEATNSMALQERSLPDDHRKQHGVVATQGYHESNTKEKVEREVLEDTICSRSQDSGPPSPPSPPLEHMKISFHPMNRTMTSKLKLEFPDGHLHESIEELMFPSFQLLPGPAASMQHLSSDSDDDTFCRSSPSYSEDVPSHHSDSDFELWEPNEWPESRNHNMPDASHTVSSSTALISSSLDLDKVNHHPVHAETEYGNSKSVENGLITFQSGEILDIPSLESLKSSISKQEGRCDSGHKDPPVFTLEAPNEQPPPAPLPPLPPVQWRIMKSSLPCLEDGQHCRSDVANLSTGMEAQDSVRQQSEHVACKPPQPPQPPQPADIGKATLHSDKSMMASQNINGNKGVDLMANAKELDERGDFLHQIRSKSFNLRRTIATKQSFAPGPTTSVKVAAILEKANAIRQAVVSSDDGGDENWSDG